MCAGREEVCERAGMVEGLKCVEEAWKGCFWGRGWRLASQLWKVAPREQARCHSENTEAWMFRNDPGGAYSALIPPGPQCLCCHHADGVKGERRELGRIPWYDCYFQIKKSPGEGQVDGPEDMAMGFQSRMQSSLRPRRGEKVEDPSWGVIFFVFLKGKYRTDPARETKCPHL